MHVVLTIAPQAAVAADTISIQQTDRLSCRLPSKVCKASVRKYCHLRVRRCCAKYDDSPVLVEQGSSLNDWMSGTRDELI